MQEYNYGLSEPQLKVSRTRPSQTEPAPLDLEQRIRENIDRYLAQQMVGSPAPLQQ